MQPDDTINLRGGTYIAPNGRYFRSMLRGAENRPVTVRPFAQEPVKIDGGIEVRGEWVVFRDLEVMSSNRRRKTAEPGPFPSDITQPAGFNVFAPNAKIINNVIHNESTGISAWQDAADSEFYGNLIYYNGWLGPDRPHGHGMYMQNATGRKLIAENILFGQFELGMQFYGTSAAKLNNLHLTGNIVFNSGLLGGRPSRNIHLGGDSVAENPTLQENYTYFSTDRNHGGENNIGYYAFGAGCNGLSMTGNYFVSGGISLSLFKCTVSKMLGNLLFGELRGFEAAEYPGNTFLSTRERPSENVIFVRPNRYEEGRSQIVVFNWTRAETVTVSLAGTGLQAGDFYEIRDAQNYGGEPVVSGRFDDKPVTIPMTSVVIAKPIGEMDYPPEHTDIEFGVFIVRKVVGPRELFITSMQAENVYFGGGISTGPDRDFLIFAENRDGIVAVYMDVPEDGYYAAWFRAAAATVEPVSLLASIDDGPADVFEVAGTGGAWRWLPLNGRGGDRTMRLNPRLLRLKRGPHLLILRPHQREVALDAVVITNDLSYQPETQ